MAFTRKLKTENKWFRVNQLVRKDVSLMDAINQDNGCVSIIHEMEESIRNLYAEALNTSANDAQFTIDRVVPMPKRMWFGYLAYDVFTKVTKRSRSGNVYPAYVGTYGAAFKNQAQRLRERIDTIIELRRLTNDLGEADQRPNPGGNPRLQPFPTP